MGGQDPPLDTRGERRGEDTDSGGQKIRNLGARPGITDSPRDRSGAFDRAAQIAFDSGSTAHIHVDCLKK
eukprot:3477558-Pyramimonas_sp.AAC.1